MSDTPETVGFMESVDWHAEGYRDGKAAASFSGGRGSRWHVDQNQPHGFSAIILEYMAGWNEALDEHEQEEAK